MTPKNWGPWFTHRVTAVNILFFHLTPESLKTDGEDEPTPFEDPIFQIGVVKNHQLGIDLFSWMCFGFWLAYTFF